jgi:non-ribosomal peptide synthetase component F
MRRSVNLIVALVAILKAGAGYVTLDPDVPAQRNNFIFQDVSAAFAITDHTSKGTFPNEVIIEDLIEGAEHRNPTNLLVKQTSDDIAYVIYTSGSTGKGVSRLSLFNSVC